MKSPKHLLPFHNNQPVYIHLIQILREACPDAEIYMSLHDTTQEQQLARDGNTDLNIFFDTGDSGPADGLLAAHQAHPGAHWLVLACDYPLVSAQDLKQLRDAYEAPVTCFLNAEGWLEPLIGLWSPQALSKLKENVQRGITGPNRTVKMLNGKGIRAGREASLFNANTLDEWATALRLDDEINH